MQGDVKICCRFEYTTDESRRLSFFFKKTDPVTISSCYTTLEQIQHKVNIDSVNEYLAEIELGFIISTPDLAPRQNKLPI